jgi:hypothetical protein
MKRAVVDIDGTRVKPNRVADGCFLEALQHCFGFSDVGASTVCW